MRSDEDGIDLKSDVNGREGIVLITRSGKAVSVRFLRQGKVRLRVEVAGIKWRGAYCRSQFKGGTNFIPPD